MRYGFYPYDSLGRHLGSSGSIASFFRGMPYAVNAGLMTAAGFLAIAAYGDYLASHLSHG